MQPALQLGLLVAILLPAAKIAGSLCTRFGIPPILGELLVGVVLGPGAVNLLAHSFICWRRGDRIAHAAGADWRHGADVHRGD